MFNQLIQNDMAAVQFILSLLIALCASGMFLSAAFIHPNTHFVYLIVLGLILLGAVRLVKISYNELKSE